MNPRFLFALGVAVVLGTLSQASAQTTLPDDINGYPPAFVMHTTSRTAQAVKYQRQGGATKIGFAGTPMMPSATGIAEIRSQRGSIAIEAEFAELQTPTAFGAEYLTYILWAISPEGRAINLGEVLVSGNHRSKIKVTTDLEAFALIVTAEPYYAVPQPSDVVVLETSVRFDINGTSQGVDARYELTCRGGYIPTGYKFDPVVLDAKLPLEFLEARNALRIAKSEGAERYAGEIYQHAARLMDAADNYATEKGFAKKELIAASRETVQTAEDARAIAVKNLDEATRNSERQHSASALAHAQAEAEEASRAKDVAQANNDLAQAANARAQSDNAIVQGQRLKADSDNPMAQADRIRAKTDAAAGWANMVAAQADATASQTRMAAAQANLTRSLADADKARAEIVANQASSTAQANAAGAPADPSGAAKQLAQLNDHQADSEKAVLRAHLEERLNQILQTRNGARGLIISMSDVLFDPGKLSLNPGAQVKLAKVAGILMAYPTLNTEVGDYTDNVGSDDMNLTLSQNRAGAVRDYLVNQGLASGSVSAKGFGNRSPVAPNDNSSRRQSNRRVELVVSGEAIGFPAARSTVSLR